MGLVRLTYTSVAADGLRVADLRDIVARSQRNNRRDGLTGFLMYSAPYFTQCVEGEQAAVEALWARLAADPRHGDVRILTSTHLHTREFADWSMQLLHLDDEALRAIAPLCAEHRLDLTGRLSTGDEEQLRSVARRWGEICGSRARLAAAR